MDTRSGWRNLTKAFLVIGGFALDAFFAATSFFNFPSLEGWKTFGVLFATSAFLGAILWHVYDLQRELDKFRKRRPRLVVVETDVGKWDMTEFFQGGDPDDKFVAGTATMTRSYLPSVRGLFGSTDNVQSESEEYAIALVTFKNVRPEEQEIDTAASVSAVLTFYDEELNPLLENVAARWADMPEPSYYWLEPRERRYYLEIDIPPSTQRTLCIAAKQRHDQNCYVYNLETYTRNKVKRPDVEIAPGRKLLEVTLRGGNFEEAVYSFELNNPGRDNDITLDLIYQPSEDASQHWLLAGFSSLRRVRSRVGERKRKGKD